MNWEVGEIAGLIADEMPERLRGLVGNVPPMPVRIIHVGPEKVIVTPNLDPADEIMMKTAAMVEHLQLAEPAYMQKSFDPESGKELNPILPFTFKLIKGK